MFCWTPIQYFRAEVRKVSLENMEDKILGFQFAPVSTKRTRPSYQDGSDQDEPETHQNRLSSQEWCNCQKCEKMSTGLECVCCHEIREVKAFHLKGKARRSWNTAASAIHRSSRLQMFFRICVLKRFAIFTGKHLCWSRFFKKIFLELLFFNFIKKRPRRRCFPVNIAKF